MERQRDGGKYGENEIQRHNGINGQREAERPRDLDKLRRKRQRESKRKTDSPID
jgi:hypothetical protein